MKAKLISLISLQTPISRILVIASITTFLYIVRYQTLLSIPTISVYSRLNLPLPSIGLTRAYWFLIHGKYYSAWQMNKLIYLVALVIFIIIVIDSTNLILSLKNKKT